MAAAESQPPEGIPMWCAGHKRVSMLNLMRASKHIWRHAERAFSSQNQEEERKESRELINYEATHVYTSRTFNDSRAMIRTLRGLVARDYFRLPTYWSKFGAGKLVDNRAQRWMAGALIWFYGEKKKKIWNNFISFYFRRSEGSLTIIVLKFILLPWSNFLNDPPKNWTVNWIDQ